MRCFHQYNSNKGNGFALYYKTIFALFIIIIPFAQPIDAQIEVVRSNDGNTAFNIESFISKWEQNTKDTSDDGINDMRQRASQLMNLGILYVENGEYLEAIDCLKKASEIYLEVNDEYYFYTLIWQFHVYRSLGHANEYNALKKKIRQAIDGDKISDNKIKLLVFSKFGEILIDEGDIDEAILIEEKSLESAVEIYGISNPEIFSFLYKLCSIYIDKGNLSRSKVLIDNMKTLNLELKADKTDYYAAVLLESQWMQASGEIGKMIRLLEKTADAIDNDYLEIRSVMYSTLGSAYTSLGDFEKSQLYDEKALEIGKVLYGENSPHYAISLINLSEIYALNGLNDKALNLTINALDIMEKLYGKNNKQYIKCLQKLASRYIHVNPKKSKDIDNQCMLLWESLYGQNSREYAENLIWSNLDLSPNPSLSSIANVKKGIEIFRSLELTNYEFYSSFLHFYCIMLYMIKDYSNLYDASSELLELIRNRIYSNFLVMPESQRDIFWKSVKSDLDGIEHYAADYSYYAIENNDYSLMNKYSGLGYDARLLKKGLLLTSSRNIETIIAKLDNQDINRLIVEIKNQHNKLSSLHPGDDEYEKVERTGNNLERELLGQISSYGDFMKFISTKWQDIQDVLMPGEVAIEFFSFPCQNDIQYGMTFIACEGEPRILNLFVESELNKYLNNDTSVYDYNSPGLYKTIWATLEVFSEIKNAHTIYFSADGKLNTIAIENLCDSEGQLAAEKRNIVRLSSTRELLQKKSNLRVSFADNNRTNIVLYGGLDYNSSLPTDISNGTAESLFMPPVGLQTAQRAFKNRAQYLQGTYKEVEALNQQLKIRRNSNIIQLTGCEGTERSVIEVATLHPNLLHIATHGFYYDEANDNEVDFRSTSDSNSLSVETKAMKESGLLFSGANHKLMGEEISDSHNDGILTAEEIATIALGDVDLIVLSACETGLGAVSGEGVFGLQRGFKLSGVNSIVMSLWKVDDEATKDLMINFYKNLIKGYSKIEALREAQKQLRKTPGFEDPEYWAGFILLDGLNLKSKLI